MAKLKIPKLKNITEKLLKLRLVRIVFIWAKRHSLPGFFALPIYDVIEFVINELRRARLFTKSKSIAFSFFLSIFPALIALFTLIPYIQNFLLVHLPDGQNFSIILQDQIMQIMPGNAGREVSDFILDIVNNPRVGLTSVGFLLSIFFASNGMIAMMSTFEKSYKTTYKRRNALQQRLVAIKMTIVLGSMILASVLLVLLGDILVDVLTAYIRGDAFTAYSLFVLRWLIMVALIYFGISLLYRMGASTYQKFAWFTPGATVATILSLISSLAFSFFIDNFGTYNKLYGSIGTIIVLMIWIQINSLVILIGYELNASIAINRDLQNKIIER